MATITSLGFSIFARERVSRTFRRIGQSAEEMAGQARRAARSIGEQFEALDDTMTKAGAVAGVALGAAMVKSVDASAATAKLGAQIGATAEQSKRFGEIAGRLYSQAYGESIEDVHGAIGAVVTSIDGMRSASDSAVEGMARKALTLAKVFEIDTARSIQVVGQLVRTGLVKDATEGMDLLTVALQRVPAAVRDDLLDALDEYGPFMEQIGIKGARAFEILIQAADKGAFGLDKAGDAFKEVTLKIASSAPDVDEALQSIGMSQERVQDAFARGGAEGQRAFQQIVDGLLKIPDPGKRAETAITLFGTPIEDLNTKDIPRFLESLVGTQSELRNTAGAADRAGAAVQDTAGTKLESFKRSVEQNLSKVIAEDIIPKLEQLSSTAKGVGLTPSGAANAILALGAVAAGYKTIAFAAKIATFQVGRLSIAKGVAGAATTLSGVAAGFRNVNLAMAANASTATRLGAALRSQIMLWRQQAAATGVSTARIILNAAAQKIAAAASRVWALATALLNAVMSANPIALIIIAIVALVAAIVIAYKKSETFRNIVNAAWAGIKNAVLQAWAFIRPVFMQIASVLVTVVGTALKWYWAYVKFVFNAVWLIISTVWNTAIKPIFNAVATVLRAVLPKAFTFFQNIVKIVWIAIQIYIKIAWTLIRGYFNLIKFYVTKVLAPIFKWLWNNIVKPVFNWIVNHIKARWAQMKAAFAAIKAFINNTLAPAFRWLWNNIIRPLWNKIREHISSVINTKIKPAFNGLKTAVGKVRDAFRTAVDGIRTIWNKLKGYAKTPVNFVIGLYNDGIVKLVNRIAGFAGVKTRLNTIKKFASGGVMPGYQPNGNDPLIARVNPGEAIMRPEFTRGLGAGTIHYLNKLARTGGPKAIRDWLAGGGDRLGAEGAAFSRGGIAGGYAGRFAFGGIVGGFMKKIKDFSFLNPEKAFKSALGKITGAIPGAGIFRDAVAGIPKKLVDWLVTWFKDKIGFGGGPGMNRAMQFAKAQAGKPYVWGGVGPGGYDCCLVGETLVFGPRGPKRIDEIEAGDLVWSHENGKLVAHTVTAAWQSLTQQTFTVRTRNRSVTGSANHPFLRLVAVDDRTGHWEDAEWPGPIAAAYGSRRGAVCSLSTCAERVLARGMCSRHYGRWRKHGDPRVRYTTGLQYETQWARLDELKPGDLLVQPRAMATDTTLDPALPDGTPVDADVAWLIGAMVGDGSVTDRAARLCMYGEDRERAARVIAERWPCTPTRGEQFGLIASNVALARTLAAFGMRRHCLDKRVPDAVWTWPVELQRAFLDGYCDADGHRPADQSRHGERTYSSASADLLAEVRALHIMLGDAVSNVSVNERAKPITIKGKLVRQARPLHTFAVWQGLKTGETHLRRSPALAEWLDAGDFTVAAVLEISDAGERETYDIEVESAHNFVADGITVHNSGFMSAITNVIQGKHPYSRRFTTFSFTGANNGPAGFARNRRSGFEVGVTNAGVGHMAGTLLGKAVESRGSRGVVVGAGARGAGDSLFTMRYGLKADTGAATLAPGWNPVYNGTGRPEYLETPRRGHDGPLVTIEKVEVHDRADVDLLADQLGFRMRAQAMT